MNNKDFVEHLKERLFIELKKKIEVVCMDIHNAVWHIEQQYYIHNTIQMLYTLEEIKVINNDSIDDVTFEMKS